MAGLDPRTGIYTYADGSTYQNPHNYGTAENPQWALNGAQVGSMLGSQGAAVNAANNWDSRPVWQGGSGTQDLSGVQGGGMGAFGAGAPAGGASGFNTKPMQMGGGASFGAGQGSGATFGAGQGGSTSGQNPYLSQMGGLLAQQMTDNFNRRVMPQISSQAIAAGGFGGSRQGVVEANAMNDLNQQIASGLAGLYGNGFNTSLNYDLGLRNNNLGFANLDRNINNDNLNWQLTGANFGLGMYDRLQQGNQMGIGAGTNIQNTPMNYWSQFGNQYNSIGQGYGTTTGSASQQGNPMMGALGGAMLGRQIGNWWGNNSGGGNQPTWYTGTGGMGD
ncbi:MAG: hypothetical protein ACK40S_12950 [Burkholderiaceae bacterium]